uniref:Cell surface A33 antigen-like n=1 Tax=Sinocyclocheilus grahami TaxID=75366 RepID=A0A672Q4A3_SINGR
MTLFDIHKVLSLCLIVMSASFGLEVTMSQDTMEVARGDDVTLTCNFKPKNQVNDLIIITWIGDPDETSKEKVSQKNFNYIGSDYQGKAFIETDLTAKTSKLTLKQVTIQESRRIRCFVQIPGDIEGKTADTTFLLVQVAPSQPSCKVVGTAEYGHNISLTCVSEEGSPTPTYKWERYDVKNAPRAFPIKTTEILSLVNVSMETSGYYICLSTNKVGSAKCNMTLSVMPPSMNLATIGIVAGCIAGVTVLIIVIICCCRKRKQKQKQTNKNYEME